jgi:putative membrane protein
VTHLIISLKRTNLVSSVNLKENLALFFKGLSMGAADVVPGVSGGTIAFISGIYENLLGSLNAIDGKAVKLLFSFKLKELWEHINGSFLIVLLAGIGLSIVSLSKIIIFLLHTYPVLIWAFFFGLIIGSVFLIFPKITNWNLPVIAAGLTGIAIAYFITMATPTNTPEAYWFIFLSGALAISAMILPGISGSFILLILGKYEFILNALSEFNIPIIAIFLVGCIMGLLSFSRLLKYLLNNYHNVTIAILTGFMLGSLNKVWPWKQTVAYFTDRHGVLKPLTQNNISPFTYEEITGEPSQFVAALAFALFGFFIVYLLGKLSEKKETTV